MKFDIQDESFDAYFEKVCENMSVHQRAALPSQISNKLFVKRTVLNKKTLKSLNFLGRVFVLYLAMKKRITVTIEDEQQGLDIKTYRKYKSNARSNADYTMEEAGELIAKGAFVWGTPDVMNSVGYLNAVSSSKAYNYLIGAKNHKTKVSQLSAERDYITRFLHCYETRKGRWQGELDISMSEFLVLNFLYDGRDAPSSYLFDGVFLGAPHGSPATIWAAISSLRQKEFIIRKGDGKLSKTCITIEGKAIVDKILSQYVLNC